VAADSVLEDETVDRESISGRNAEGERHHSVLESDAAHRVVYTHATEIQYNDAVPTVATQYLNGGAVFEAVREGATVTRRVLVRDDERVGMMYDAVTGRLADAVSVEFDRLERAEGWHNPLAGRISLPEEQREALELAVERGYFEEPRAVSVGELASELGAARSTVSYRLRRATAALTEAYVDGWY
jgi:Predicted DNA binding protein